LGLSSGLGANLLLPGSQSFLALGMPKLQSDIVLIRLGFCSHSRGAPFFSLVGALIAIVFSHFTSIPIVIFYNLRFGLFNLRKESYLLSACCSVWWQDWQ
jgi:hypothetical protein